MCVSNNVLIIGVLFLACVGAFVLTGFLRRYALNESILDIPNARSSHSVPTPRGGGVAVVIVTLIGTLLFWSFDFLSSRIVYMIYGAGGMVALVGWLDDHGHVPPRWRLIVHFIAAIWALLWLGGLPSINLPLASLNLGWVGYIVATFYLVWVLNLYNFMDGIDGIAAIEAITVCLGGVLVYFVSLPGTYVWLLPMLLAISVLGFLWWNFPRAKIFMGDAGSGFIGVLLGVFTIQAAWSTPDLLWSWLILLGVFVVDSTVTLLRRLLRGEKIYEAHRSHAYQYAARKYGSHQIVSVSVGVINIIWLLPIAGLVSVDIVEGLYGLIIAYIPLVGLVLWLKAGSEQQ